MKRHLHGSFAFFVLSAFAAGQGTSTVLPETRINVGGFNPSSANAQDGISLAYDGTRSRFVAVYAEQAGTSSGTQDIYFVSSSDEGLTWTAPVRVDLGDAANSADSQFPEIAVTSSGAYVVVWEENRDALPQGSTNQDVFANRSVDGGATWGANAFPLNTLSAGANIDSDVDRVHLAVDGNAVYVIWEEDLQAGINGDEEVQFVRSLDSGATFSAPVFLTPNPGPTQGDVDDPQLVASGGVLLVSYTSDVLGNDQVFVQRSIDQGATFTLVSVESDISGNADAAVLAMDGDLVVCAWTDNYGGMSDAIRAAVSTDGGQTFGPEIVCAPMAETAAVGDADDPQVAVQGNNIYIAWPSDHAGVQGGSNGGSDENEIYFARSNDGGATFTVEELLPFGIPTNRPLIGVNPISGTLHLFAERNANGSNTGLFSWSSDGGATFAAPVEVPTMGSDVDPGNFVIEGEVWAISPVSNTMLVGVWNNPLGQNEAYVCGNSVSDSLGMNFCTAASNSTGVVGRMRATGSTTIATNLFTLRTEDLPPGQFGIFVVGQLEGSSPVGEGFLCLGGPIGRYQMPDEIFQVDGAGRGELTIDLAQIPTPTAFVAVQPGETWRFQAWHRDNIGGVNTSNFTDGLAVVFN